jgi:hypothetical protein
LTNSMSFGSETYLGGYNDRENGSEDHECAVAPVILE